ncbi:hypothetical protein EDE15_4785 [Edaphobacter aggregans]|uniref:Uncharacterized protein n=1 Tax=Edaphobacter aggregans TaxID=570835 RepID=A0A3R9P0H8_9BACT|nr:hypothetical protein EDE15_4785 [Edaphobacter aggregans]
MFSLLKTVDVCRFVAAMGQLLDWEVILFY